MDTVVGFAIAGVLAIALVTAITATGRANRRLEDGATAMRMAQRVMGTLQEGKDAPKTMDEATVELKPAAGGTTLPGRAWVEVVIHYRGRTASLIGMTPNGGGQ